MKKLGPVEELRAGLAAKRDQLRHRHRLQKHLLRQGRRPPEKIKAWTETHLQWAKDAVHFEQPVQEATLIDYLNEVERVPRAHNRRSDSISSKGEADEVSITMRRYAPWPTDSSRSAERFSLQRRISWTLPEVAAIYSNY